MQGAIGALEPPAALSNRGTLILDRRGASPGSDFPPFSARAAIPARAARRGGARLELRHINRGARQLPGSTRRADIQHGFPRASGRSVAGTAGSSGIAGSSISTARLSVSIPARSSFSSFSPGAPRSARRRRPRPSRRPSQRRRSTRRRKRRSTRRTSGATGTTRRCSPQSSTSSAERRASMRSRSEVSAPAARTGRRMSTRSTDRRTARRGICSRSSTMAWSRSGSTTSRSAPESSWQAARSTAKARSTSPDGTAWRVVDQPTGINMILRAHALFLAGTALNDFQTSADGAAWTTVSRPLLQMRSAAYGNGTYVVFGPLRSDGVRGRRLVDGHHAELCERRALRHSAGRRCGQREHLCVSRAGPLRSGKFWVMNLQSADGKSWSAITDVHVPTASVGDYLFNWSAPNPSFRCAWRVGQPPVTLTVDEIAAASATNRAGDGHRPLPQRRDVQRPSLRHPRSRPLLALPAAR